LIGINLNLITSERIAGSCVCCGSTELNKSPAILMPFIAARAFGWYPVEIDDSWGLKTITNGMAHSVCNSLTCRKCNHLFLDIRFSDSEMSRLYRDYRGQDYVNLRDSFEPGYAIRNETLNNGVSFLDEVESFLIPYISAPLTILDWGGDTGINTPFKSIAEKVDIYDISRKNVISGVNQVSLDQAQMKKYQLIICSQVLEHIPYPTVIINAIKKCMDQDSILYIELPCEELVRNFEGEKDLSVRKKHWHEHINFYTKSSLDALLNYCGFAAKEIRTSKVSMGNDFVYIYQVIAKLRQ